MISPQFIITATAVAENVYSITARCKWFSTPIIVLRTIGWTAWNGMFLSMLVCVPVSTSVPDTGLETASCPTMLTSFHWCSAS